MKTNSLNSMLHTAVVLVLLSATPVFGEKKARLDVRYNSETQSLTALFAPALGQEPCDTKLYVATKRKALRGSLRKAQTLGSFESTTDNYILVATSIPKLRKKRKVFLRAKTTCSTTTSFSNFTKLRVPKERSSDISKISDWVSSLTFTVPRYSLVEAFSSFSFSSPVDLQVAPGQTNRLYVVEQGGVVRFFDTANPGEETQEFLDISNIVDFSGEKGLLGMAFHPEFESNGYFFVHYSAAANGATTLARYQVIGGVVDLTSAVVFLSVPQPAANHNGGTIAFGPDGNLYLSLGDGGGAGDPFENGQDKTSLLGTILRINVDLPGSSTMYSIPKRNPFRASKKGFREEIYAYGLRNPFKFSFDQRTGELWAGDVGQNAVEEINIIKRGKNYGWNLYEGNRCFQPLVSCASKGLTAPVHTYPHSVGSSVTGGQVYYGTRTSSLHGAYVYGDFVSGKVWALWKRKKRIFNIPLVDSDFFISSFGLDHTGDLYLLDYVSGKILMIEETL